MSQKGWVQMSGFWYKTKEVVLQKASSLKGKVSEYSTYSKLSVSRFNLNKQLEKLESELGRRVYTLFTEKSMDTLKDDEEALNYMLKIRGLENEIQELEERIKSLSAEEKEAKKST